MASPTPAVDWHQTPFPNPLLWISSFVLIAAGAPWVGGELLGASSSLFRENGSIEMMQASLLVLAACLFAVACRRTTDAKAIFCGGMALVSLLALQRELPACESLFYEGGACITRPGKGIFSGLAALAVGVLVLTRGVRWRPFFEFRNIRWTWPVALSLSLLLLAEVAERRIHPEVEEMLELGAYLYLVVFAIWLNRAPRTDRVDILRMASSSVHTATIRDGRVEPSAAAKRSGT